MPPDATYVKMSGTSEQPLAWHPIPQPRHRGSPQKQGGGSINGQVAVSALGSSCACPTAFITFCPSWRLQRIQFHRHVQPAPSLNGWGCDLQDSTSSGVHPGQWSLLHQALFVISWGSWASKKLSGGSLLDLSKLQDPRTLGYSLIFGLYSKPIAYC